VEAEQRGGGRHLTPMAARRKRSDARAAVRIMVRDFHGDGREVYLVGYSMGGGVALALAGQMPGIRAIVGVSPFVGYDIDYRWVLRQERMDMDKSHGTTLALEREAAFFDQFAGTLATEPHAYAAQSDLPCVRRVKPSQPRSTPGTLCCREAPRHAAHGICYAAMNTDPV
jgi:pimeloyl-ACP methyl ester carboxylesterase